MDKYVVERYQTKYFRNINEALNIHQLANTIQFGGSVIIDDNNWEENEKRAYEVLIDSLKQVDCDKQKTLDQFKEFKEILQTIYLELGIQAGICLQAELLSEQLEDKI